MDRSDAPGRNVQPAATVPAIELDRALSRRTLMRGAAQFVPLAMVSTGIAREALAADTQTNAAPLTFAPVAENQNDTVTVPNDYKYDVLLRWGDALVPGLGAHDINNQTPQDQAQRVGFNHDMIALFPLPYGSPATDTAGQPWNDYIIAFNNEYVTYTTMFAFDVPTTGPVATNVARVGLEAQGVTIARIQLVNGTWQMDVNSKYNRRITGTTAMQITGPAAGDPLLRTAADPTGTRVFGTLGNCSGGFTPWGTYLTAEENFNGYFANAAVPTDASVRADYSAYGITGGASTSSLFELADPRFNLATPQGQNEPFRFGWVVEIDPYDPTSTPKKRTSMGRFKHEAAQMALSPSNRAVVYTGDDEVFEYVYKFVSSKSYFPGDRAANMDLLDQGTLYAARFNDDGTGQWLALDFATLNQLRPGFFRNQADVLIRARLAADILGATPMDRPEDVEPMRGPDFVGNGRVFIVCTKNNQRVDRNAPNSAGAATAAPRGRSAFTNGPNPRGGATFNASTGRLSGAPGSNVAGHIIELNEAQGDVASLFFSWRIFILAGDPWNPAAPLPSTGAAQNVNVANSITYTMFGDRFGAPDNITFDSTGNLWIATDGNPDVFKCNDSVLVTSATQGQPHLVKRFLTGPVESEICGPLLTPDDSTFFCAIQHPGELGPIVTRGTTKQTSSWPNGDVPRPAIVAVRRKDGRRVGS